MKLKTLLPVFLFLICCSVYILAAFPSVAGGDSGEIITAAFILGIPHPPGYPLYTLLGKAFTCLPVSSIAFRVNLLACFFGALASLMLFRLTVLAVKRMTSTIKEAHLELSASIVALAFGFSGIFFEQALNAKGGIYTLNAFLMFSIIFFVLKFVENPKVRSDIFFASFLLGLGLANHQTIILILPSLLLYLFMTERRIFTVKSTLVSAGFVLLGAAFYIYLPVRSLANPPLDWGNPENFTNFIAHITRKGYGKLSQNAYSLDLIFKQTIGFFKYLVSEILPVFALLGLLGVYQSYKSDKKIFWTFFSLLLILGPCFIFIINPEPASDDWPFIKIFTVPAISVFLIFSAAGIGKLFDLLKNKKYISSALSVLLAVILGYNLYTNFKQYNNSSDRIALIYGKNILKTMDKDGVLFASDDSVMFPLAYLTMVEKVRPDVKIYDDFGWIFEHVYGDGFAYLTEKEQSVRRLEYFKRAVEDSGKTVYFTPGSRVQNAEGVQMASLGLLKTASNKKQVFGPERQEKLWNSYEAISGKPYKDQYSRHLAACYTYLNAEYLAQKGDRDGGMEKYEEAGVLGADDPWIQNNLCSAFYKLGMFEPAIRCGFEAVRLDKKSSEACNNLALALAKAGRKEEAAEYYRKASALNPGFSVSDYNTALMYFKEGKAVLALEYANKAIMNNPDYYQAYIITGSVHFGNKKYDEALTAFKKSRDLNPAFPEARYNLGAVYLELGNNKQAKEELSEYLRLSPNAANSAQIKELLKSLSK